jgi:hypothetical protein
MSADRLIFPRTCASPQDQIRAMPVPELQDDRPLRFSFVESEEPQPMVASSQIAGRTDLEMVEGLLDRCWLEVGASDLNPKMTDIVRLLEFKNKLRSTAEAEKTFWALINRIRHEELSEFGLVTVSDTPLE